jgi:RHS repeat-associated protein
MGRRAVFTDVGAALLDRQPCLVNDRYLCNPKLFIPRRVSFARCSSSFRIVLVDFDFCCRLGADRSRNHVRGFASLVKTSHRNFPDHIYTDIHDRVCETRIRFASQNISQRSDFRRLGRFLQPDPKEFAAGDYNLYRYCHNDPVNKNDPWGLEWVKIWIEKSGNWGDKNDKDYYKDNLTANNKPAEGTTKADLKKLTPNSDGSVSTHLFVDTHVRPVHRDGKVDTKEQEHPNGWKDFAKTLSDRVFMKFKDQTHGSPSEAAKAQADYIQKLFREEWRRQNIWDMPGRTA